MPREHTPPKPPTAQPRSEAGESAAGLPAGAGRRLPETLPAVIHGEEGATAPAFHNPTLEPVPVPGCVICKAAGNGRTSSRARGDVPGVREYNGLISTHPHRATAQGKAVNADVPEDAVPACPGVKATVADDRLEDQRADDGDSEALRRLRARVHQDYARWQRYGPLGRSL